MVLVLGLTLTTQGLAYAQAAIADMPVAAAASDVPPCHDSDDAAAHDCCCPATSCAGMSTCFTVHALAPASSASTSLCARRVVFARVRPLHPSVAPAQLLRPPIVLHG